MPGPESGSNPLILVLNLEGVECGRVGLVTGGNATADVISEPPGPDHIVKKHLAGVKYEDIVMSFGMDIMYHYVSKFTISYIRQIWPGGKGRTR